MMAMANVKYAVSHSVVQFKPSNHTAPPLLQKAVDHTRLIEEPAYLGKECAVLDFEDKRPAKGFALRHAGAESGLVRLADVAARGVMVSVHG